MLIKLIDGSEEYAVRSQNKDRIGHITIPKNSTYEDVEHINWQVRNISNRTGGRFICEKDGIFYFSCTMEVLGIKKFKLDDLDAGYDCLAKPAPQEMIEIVLSTK